MNSGDSRKSFRKALFLSLVFILVLIFANALIKFASSPNRFMAIGSGQKNSNVSLFNEEEKEPVKKKIAGFWYCTNSITPQIPFLKISDRIELKDNGIFWRFKRNVIVLPSKDSALFFTVMTGYMSPFSRSKTCSDSLTFQIHFIAQVDGAGKDTCYDEIIHPSEDSNKSAIPQILRTPKKAGEGEAAVDTAWDIFANGKRFEFEGRPYEAYDTAGNALASFFPAGALKIIENIALVKCNSGKSLESFAKKSLVADFASLSVPGRTSKDILSAVDTYYKGMFAINLSRRVTVFAKGTVIMSFFVTSQGKVLNPTVDSAKPWNMKLNKALKSEVLTWAFPQCAKQAEPMKITFTFSY